jgi:hypothetical protein
MMKYVTRTGWEWEVEVDFSEKNIYHKSANVQARGKNFTSETYLYDEKLLLRDFANQKGRV